MPNTLATPEMVNQVGGLPEFEMTQEGVRPVNSQNQANPSPAASPEGAPAEPAGNAAEATPPATAQTPATPQVPATTTVVQPKAVEPAPNQPAVTVAPAQTAVAQPAPTSTEATAPTQTEVKPADDGLAKLGAYIQGETAKAVEEVRRTAQSQYDRQNVTVAQALQNSKEATVRVTQELRELQTRDLSEAEKAKVMETYAQNDERAELDNYRTELVGYHNTVFDDSLLVQYRDVEGVTKETLAAIETPEEKELYCEQRKSASLEKQLEESKVTATTPAAPVVAAPAPTAVSAAVPNAPEVPAGATAPSDIGTGGASPPEKKFNEEASEGAMHQNLRNLDWSRVNIAPGS